MTTAHLVPLHPFRPSESASSPDSPVFGSARIAQVMLCACSLLALSAPALAQAQALGDEADVNRPVAASGAVMTDAPTPASADQVGFASDTVQYDDEADIVTAQGNVQMVRDGHHLRADKVVWNRKTGKILASGNVVAVDPSGSAAYGDQIDLAETLKDGVAENLLVVMERQQRIASTRGTRTNGIYSLERAVYTPCSVESSDNCPKKPTWQIKAVKVVYDPYRQRISYHNARMEMFGVPVIGLPFFTHSAGPATSGLLTPHFRFASQNGLELGLPYYIRLGTNRELTVTPYFYTEQYPMLSATYKSYTHNGAYRISGYITNSKRTTNQSVPILLPNGKVTAYQQRDWRGYVDASGKLQLSPNWSLSGSVRRASDRTFLRRYNILWDDHLRSTVQAERVGDRSYFSLAGWAVQTMRTAENQGLQPIALPVMDYRLRVDDPLLGGKLQFQLNSLAISRSRGQDTQRAFASAEWNLRRLTNWGQELKLTALGRADVYHSRRNYLTAIATNQGKTGWRKRGIVVAAADVRWPFIGRAFGSGTQRFTPRFQIVAAPRLSNQNVPNEDSITVELEDGNLFALNRFSGYDRFEDSTRITYGLEYDLNVPNFTLKSVVGQSYRLNRRPTLLPNGTGLSSRLSDIVGRTTLRYKDWIALTHRYRLDKDNLAIRRNEIEATVGSYRTYATIGYQRLNRNINSALLNLPDHEEVRIGARLQLAKFWSVFGSTVIDMTNRSEEPTSGLNGFQPVRQRAGIEYQDNCLNVSLTWKRLYFTVGDAKRDSSFTLQVAFRNLGL